MLHLSNQRYRRTPATSRGFVLPPESRYISSACPASAWMTERSGLDYWPEVILERHQNLEALYKALPGSRFIYLTTKADQHYTDWSFEPDDCLIFGRETRGLPEDILRAHWDHCLRIPMLHPTMRFPYSAIV